MKEKTCAVIDSGTYAKIDAKELESQILNLLLLGVTDFLFSGTEGSFELACAKTIQRLKKIYPNIKCVSVTVKSRLYITAVSAYALCYVDCIPDKVRIFKYDSLRGVK